MPRRLVRNRTSLATTSLRRDALAVLEAGLRAIDTRRAVRAAFRLQGSKLRLGGRSWDLSRFERIYVVGIGKAAYDAAVEIERILGRRIEGGIVLDVKSGPLRRMTSIAGTHPLPSLANMRATGEIVALLKQAGSKDLVIAVVSGGGSALLCWPYGMKGDALAGITDALMRKGASIREINTVRKHLSEIQGGQFARMAYPATVIGLLFSDVPGDDPGIIASGPTVRDTTTADDAAAILAKHDILRTCRMPDCRLRETPKDPVFFSRVANVIVMSNRAALRAMAAEARRLGYAARVLSRELSGEARDVGRRLAGLPRRGEMVLAAGETTVTVRGKGRGGRNQEVALGALSEAGDDVLVISCASDGIDNTPAAGAIADAVTRRQAAAKRLDARAALSANASYDFFRKLGQQIITGKTGANVSDLMIAARARRKGHS
ncbi:MAG: hypothetical protein RL272_1224 [Candidatus Parcubacteria bacterium]